MTIHPETEIVSTSHNAALRVHTYVVERNGRRWTVQIPDADFAQFGAVLGANAAVNRMARRKHLAVRLEAAMQGEADA